MKGGLYGNIYSSYFMGLQNKSRRLRELIRHLFHGLFYL